MNDKNKRNTMHTHINYTVLLDQLKHLLPMLKARALESIDYGDSVTGEIHHRIFLDTTLLVPQFVLQRVNTDRGQRITYVGSCDIGLTLNLAQRMIQEAHVPKRRSMLSFFFRAKKPSNMQYFAY